MGIAIVTGASSGIGKCFVHFLDKDEQFEEIWVISRNEEKLNELQSQVRAKIRVISLDLTARENLAKFKGLLEESKPKISVLVNASGYGIFHSFSDTSEEDVYGMIDLNVTALTAITYYAIPYMEKGGRIYEMGSLSSFQPVPYISEYGATKAYVLSLTRAINREMKSKCIRAMAVCPGWVKTNFFNRAQDDKTISFFDRYYSPEQVVERAISDMKKGKDVSTVGLPVRNQIRLVKLLPHRLVMNIWCKQQKQR